MSKNSFIIPVLMVCFFAACRSEDENVMPVENIRDWYEVKDKPGELHHSIYTLYRDHGVTIFINDTLGQEERGTDAYGNPVIHTEMFDMGYYVYGTYTDGRMVLSADTAAMLIAVNMIKERVIPWLPEQGEYRPHSYLLADSVFVTERISYYNVTYETDIYSKGIKGMVIGKLNAIGQMNREELNWFGGEILAVKCASWIQENCIDELEAFYKITGDSYYDALNMLPPAEAPGEIGFIKWMDVNISSRDYIKTPGREQDIRDYVTAVYAYRGEEAGFNDLYGNFKKVISKFDLIKPMVRKFEEANGVKINSGY